MKFQPVASSGKPDPFISVATPVWNAAATVKRTLESLQCQKASFEHVVYDGGSVDGTADIVRDYQDRYPIRLMQGENLGVYGNVANAHRTTTGAVMGWINGDDFYLPWTLHLVEQLFRQYPHIRWLSGIPSWHWETDGLWKVKEYVPIYNRTLIRRGWYRDNRLGCIQQESQFWRRSLYEEVGGDSILRAYRYAADFQLWRAFAARAELHSVSTVLSAFTVRQGQFSQVRQVEYRRECGAGQGEWDLGKLGEYFNRAYSTLFFKKALAMDSTRDRIFLSNQPAGSIPPNP